PDLSLSKTSIPTTFIQGQTGIYAIQVNNIGNADSSGVITVTDTPGPNLTVVSATGSGWTCNSGAPVTCTTNAVIPAGGSSSLISVTVNVAANGQTSVSNTVTVAGGGDANPSNNSFQLVSNVNAPDLSVSKTATPAAFTRGQNAVYTIQV